MGIYREWDKFCAMAKESAGTAGSTLPTPASWKNDIPSYLDAGKIFIEVCLLMLLYLWNFYLWLDIIILLGT